MTNIAIKSLSEIAKNYVGGAVLDTSAICGYVPEVGKPGIEDVCHFAAILVPALKNRGDIFFPIFLIDELNIRKLKYKGSKSELNHIALTLDEIKKAFSSSDRLLCMKNLTPNERRIYEGFIQDKTLMYTYGVCFNDVSVFAHAYIRMLGFGGAAIISNDRGLRSMWADFVRPRRNGIVEERFGFFERRGLNKFERQISSN